MAKHIGIVACSAEGAALSYRTIAREAAGRMGEHAHPEITMHTFPLAAYMPHIRAGAWDEVAALMLASAEKVARCGAEFCISPDNTIHQAFAAVEAGSPVPWLHIARVVAAAAREAKYKKLAVLGTKYLMEGPVYPEALGNENLGCVVPEDDDRARIDAIIFGELVRGELREPSRLYLSEVVERCRARGADAAVLGCTELPLLVKPDDCPLPTLDSTRLLARAALDYSLA